MQPADQCAYTAPGSRFPFSISVPWLEGSLHLVRNFMIHQLSKSYGMYKLLYPDMYWEVILLAVPLHV